MNFQEKLFCFANYRFLLPLVIIFKECLSLSHRTELWVSSLGSAFCWARLCIVFRPEFKKVQTPPAFEQPVASQFYHRYFLTIAED